MFISSNGSYSFHSSQSSESWMEFTRLLSFLNRPRHCKDRVFVARKLLEDDARRRMYHGQHRKATGTSTLSISLWLQTRFVVGADVWSLWKRLVILHWARTFMHRGIIESDTKAIYVSILRDHPDEMSGLMGNDLPSYHWYCWLKRQTHSLPSPSRLSLILLLKWH